MSSGAVGPPAGSPPGRRSRVWLGVVIAVVVVIVVVFVVVYFLSLTAGVHVTFIAVASDDDACGLSGELLPGLTGPEGGTAVESWSVTNYNTTASCTIESASTSMPGFAVTGSNLPLTIPASSSGTLSIHLSLPATAYSGPLVIDLS